MSARELIGLSRHSALDFGATLTSVVVAVVIVATLYFAREVLVPISLAILLSFVLAPLVRLLQRVLLPRGVAVLFVVALAFGVIFALGALMVSQVNQLAEDLPKYQTTLRDKIQSLRSVVGGTGTLERASDVLKELSKEIERPAKPFNESSAPPAQSEPTRPIPVEVRQPDPGALRTLVALITPLIHPLTTTGIVVIFVIFILLQREDLRNRLIRLAGSQDLQRTTMALDDAGQRLSRLFLTQLALNATFGLVVGAGLWMIGVPSAPLWGMLAAILRFVPYIGAFAAAVFPLILAAAVGPNWSMLLWTAALFIVVEPVVGHVIEPLVYGKSSGLSPVAIITSAAFWTWLWGPIGLILATPLSICLVVLGRHINSLNFLDVMFGDKPALTPPELIYQRLLARDPVEVTEQARAFLKSNTLVEFYDELLLEGLRLAEVDAERGRLEKNQMQQIRDAVAEVVDDLASHIDHRPSLKAESEGEKDSAPLAQIEHAEHPTDVPLVPEPWRIGKPVLCVPGGGLLDECVALMLAHIIERRGIGARAEQADALSMSRIFGWDASDASLICLCYLEHVSAAKIRYAVRRVRRRAPDALILIALIGASVANEEEDITDEKTSVALHSVDITALQVLHLARGSTVPSSEQGRPSRSDP
jgi:predicted PurR-regulated permease PerM